VCMRVYSYTCVCVCVCVCAHMRMRMCACICVYGGLCMCTLVSVPLCVFLYYVLLICCIRFFKTAQLSSKSSVLDTFSDELSRYNGRNSMNSQMSSPEIKVAC